MNQYTGTYMYMRHQASQQAQDVMITSLLRRNEVAMPFWSYNNDVIARIHFGVYFYQILWDVRAKISKILRSEVMEVLRAKYLSCW